MSTENDQQQPLESTSMPRREFIRKSLIASGGTFVGMGSLGKLSLPELTASMKPRKPSSGDDDDDDGDWKPKTQNTYGGRYGISRLESAVKTDAGE